MALRRIRLPIPTDRQAGTCRQGQGADAGDPGVDNKIIEDYLSRIVHNAKREIDKGYGLRGYYYEGHHCGRLSSNTGLIPFTQCYRNAAGKDLVKNSVNAGYVMTLQKGAPPEVTVKDGVVTVGKQVIKFDGDKLILSTIAPEIEPL